MELHRSLRYLPLPLSSSFHPAQYSLHPFDHLEHRAIMVDWNSEAEVIRLATLIDKVRIFRPLLSLANHELICRSFR